MSDVKDRQGTESDESLNPSQADYDSKFNDIAGNFGASADGSAEDANIRGMRQAEENPSGINTGAASTSSAGQQGAKSFGAAELAAGEAGGSSSKGLFNASSAADAVSPLARLTGALSSRKPGKGGLFASGGITVLILGLVFGIGTITTFEIETIEKNLVADVSKVEKHFEKRRAQRDIQRTISRAVRRLHGTKAERAQIADEEAAGGELTSAIDNFDVTNPEIVADLERSGITVSTDAEGKFSGLKNAAGEDITNSIATDDAVFADVEAALPEWDVGQIESFRTLLIDHANASFAGIPEDTAPEDVDRVIENSVEHGASQSEVDRAAAVEDQSPKPTDPNAPPDPQHAQAVREAGVLGDALDATNAAIASGETPTAAIETGANSVNLGNPLFASAIATTACSLKSDVDVASKSRVPKIMKLLIRHATLLAAAAQEVHSGKMKASTMAKLVAVYNGDSSVKPTKDNPNPEAALPFSNSAAWQRITGKKVNTDRSSFGFTPDISNSARPTAKAGTKIVEQLDSIAASTGISTACGALTSNFGLVVQGAFGIVQLVSDVGSLGASQVALTLGIVGAQETIKHVVLPEIIKYFTVYGLNGLEDSVQNLNNGHAGGLLAFGDYARRVGGSPMTSAATDKVVAAANQDTLDQQSRMSWTDRTFAISNPSSLTARLAVSIPTTNKGIVLGVANFFTSLPSTLGHTFSSLLFFNKASAADPGTNAESAYGITVYGFSDAEIDKYDDPVQNEIYLKTSVSYTDPGTHQTVSKVRLDMAGDPNPYEAGRNTDPNSNDLLHCFINGFDEAAQQRTGSPDPICGSVGSFDYESAEPHPMDDSNVATSYCIALTGSASAECLSQVSSQVHDDIGHFRQYMLDVHIMHDYTSLGTST